MVPLGAVQGVGETAYPHRPAGGEHVYFEGRSPTKCSAPASSLSYTAAVSYFRIERSRHMVILDAPLLLAAAVLISSLSTVIWSLRRRP